MRGRGKIPSCDSELWSGLLLHLISIDDSVCLHISSFNNYLSACQELDIILGVGDSLVNRTRKDLALILVESQKIMSK